MKQRLYDQAAAALSMALLAGLAATSYYLAELSATLGNGTQVRRVTHEPDYFVDGFSLTRLNAGGQPTFRMSAQRLLHYPDDDSTEFTQPVLVSLDPTRPVVTLRADRGTASREGEQTHLYDQVVMTREEGGGLPPTKVNTDYVLLLANDDIARTDRPVRITRGESSLTGVGMEFNNALRTLDVHSQVRGVWAAPVRK